MVKHCVCLKAEGVTAAGIVRGIVQPASCQQVRLMLQHDYPLRGLLILSFLCHNLEFFKIVYKCKFENIMRTVTKNNQASLAFLQEKPYIDARMPAYFNKGGLAVSA